LATRIARPDSRSASVARRLKRAWYRDVVTGPEGSPYGLLGLSEGDAHVIRNAGGVITDDEVRSLAISQRLLGTREIILIHHTDCGMLTFTDDEFKAQIEADTGLRPGWAPESFRDPAADVKQSLARIAANPFIPHKDHVRGFVYSVTDGSLTEIT